MFTKSAILILVVIAMIGAVFTFYMFKFMPPVTETPNIVNKAIERVEEKKTIPEEKTPLTTQEKKERLNQIFEELNKDNAEEDSAKQTEEKAAKTAEIFKELNSTEPVPVDDKTQAQIDQEKRQRLEDIFEELNK